MFQFCGKKGKNFLGLQNENNKVIEIEALDVLVLENIYLLFILIKPTIYARELCDCRNLMGTHFDTDWELPIE